MQAGLEKLEYRGYDSCGIAVLSGADLLVIKDRLRVSELFGGMPRLAGSTGIGHTRWASCGEPSASNAHPHLDCRQRTAVVHNGVVTNFLSLRTRLLAEGHHFLSDTDSEVLPHLIEQHYSGNLEEAVARALAEVEGTYALAAVRAGEDKLVLARRESALVIGVGDGEFFAASDVTAFLEYTHRVIYLEDGDLAVLTATSLEIRHDGARVERETVEITWGVDEAHQAGYPHFMLKEIHDQPSVLRQTLGTIEGEDGARAILGAEDGGGHECLLMLACGTSYNAALAGKYIFEELAGVEVGVEMASEFNYYRHTRSYGRAVAISQSGETADTLKAVRRLKETGCRVLAVTNVPGSSLARLADYTIHTRAGPEKSVAATKTYIAQLAVLYGLALQGMAGGGAARQPELLAALEGLPDLLQRWLENHQGIMRHGRFLVPHASAFYLGRGINYPVALEGALKLKELAYIHAEGHAAGELKHGPLALLGERMPVVAVIGRDSTREAMLTSLREVKARHSPVIAVADEQDDEAEAMAEHTITVPVCPAVLSPLVNVVALQLLAYYTAVEKGCPVDFPRNLAKSVTVE
jgi:glucosamine--fructose-6-phosphate aminotransferase (isomerizing)